MHWTIYKTLYHPTSSFHGVGCYLLSTPEQRQFGVVLPGRHHKHWTLYLFQRRISALCFYRWPKCLCGNIKRQHQHYHRPVRDILNLHVLFLCSTLSSPSTRSCLSTHITCECGLPASCWEPPVRSFSKKTCVGSDWALTPTQCRCAGSRGPVPTAVGQLAAGEDTAAGWLCSAQNRHFY